MKYPDDYINKVICGDCLEVMKGIPDESVDLVVTSPPYMNLKEYSYWKTYDEYLQWCFDWIKEIYRVLNNGCYFALNICWQFPRKTIKGYENQKRIEIPLSIHICNILLEVGFEWEHFIIWSKHNASQVMLGSYPFPPSLIIRQTTEPVIIVKKVGIRNKPVNKDKSRISIRLWNKCANDIWNISPEKASKIEHPAPFPIGLPSRLIAIHSFYNDIVLDPFLGSGTTAVACKQLNRRFIGIDTGQKYREIARRRLKAIPESLFK